MCTPRSSKDPTVWDGRIPAINSKKWESHCLELGTLTGGCWQNQDRVGSGAALSEGRHHDEQAPSTQDGCPGPHRDTARNTEDLGFSTIKHYLKKYILYIRIEHIYGVDWDFNRCI